MYLGFDDIPYNLVHVALIKDIPRSIRDIFIHLVSVEVLANLTPY